MIGYKNIIFIALIGLLLIVSYNTYESYKSLDIRLNQEVSKEEIIEAQNLINEIASFEIYNGKKIEIDKETWERLSEHITFKTDFVLWKGSMDGSIKLKSRKSEKVRVSYYGGFFAIDGVNGYYVFDDEESRDLWEQVVFGESLSIEELDI